MSILSAERSFKRGLAAMVDSRHRDAARLFHAAVEIEKRRGAARPDMRYLSYYGLSLARSDGPGPKALRACKRAVDRDPRRPLLLMNLGRVYLMSGQRGLAFDCFDKAAALAPDHGPLRVELERLDQREGLALGGLSRSNPLNRVLGRFLVHWRPKPRPAPCPDGRRYAA